MKLVRIESPSIHMLLISWIVLLAASFFFKNNKERFQKLYNQLNKYAKDEFVI